MLGASGKQQICDEVAEENNDLESSRNFMWNAKIVITRVVTKQCPYDSGLASNGPGEANQNVVNQALEQLTK